MKKIDIILMCGILLAACTKHSDPPVQQPDEPKTFADSSALVASNWIFVQDSLSNVNNFVFPDGSYPSPGVLVGLPGDYWNFNSNDSVFIKEQNEIFPTATYKFLPNNQLHIYTDPPLENASITILNSKNFVFIFNQTSINGGIYWRRVTLKKE
jgi:hypothetical protein